MKKIPSANPLIAIGVGVTLHYLPTTVRKVISPIMAFVAGTIS